MTLSELTKPETIVTITLTADECHVLKIAANRGVSKLLDEKNQWASETANAANEVIQKIESAEIQADLVMAKARQIGEVDGRKNGIEEKENGTYWNGQGSADWHSGLIKSLGNRKVRRLFGLVGDIEQCDDPVYANALAAYNEEANKAYDAA